MRGLFIAALGAVLCAPAWAEPAVVVDRGIIYGMGGATPLKLDIACPAGTGPFPAVVLLHGGGWERGDRSAMSPLMRTMAMQGYVAVAPSYRLAPASRFPAQIEDCKAAVRWMRAYARDYHIDPNHIAAIGFSAGGHLACLLGVTGPKDGLEGHGGHLDQSSRVEAVVSFFGPTDFVLHNWPVGVNANIVAAFLGGTYTQEPLVYKEASPISYVTRGEPPFLFVHGALDPLVPVEQSRLMLDRLKSFGNTAELITLDGEGHGFTAVGYAKSLTQVLAFLRKSFSGTTSTITVAANGSGAITPAALKTAH